MMNAPVTIRTAISLTRLERLLTTLARSGASSWWLHDMHLADVVDPLQHFAVQTGLVGALGQDRVQELMAEPFKRHANGSRQDWSGAAHDATI
jgi:hypothetical protein